MKIFLKLLFSILLFAVVYLSFNYNTTQSKIIQNEATYYINHNSDITYIMNSTLNNTKQLIKYAMQKIGE